MTSAIDRMRNCKARALGAIRIQISSAGFRPSDIMIITMASPIYISHMCTCSYS